MVDDFDDLDVEECVYSSTLHASIFTSHNISDEPLRGPVQEFQFSDDDEEDEPVLPSKAKKSKQSERPTKIIPTGSDKSSDSDEEESDEDSPTTMANMEARSRALDAKAAAEAELDAEELQQAAFDEGDDDLDMDDDVDEVDEEDKFHLPTAAERLEEKKSGGPDVHLVQRRMRECVRVLGRFKKLAEPGR